MVRLQLLLLTTCLVSRVAPHAGAQDEAAAELRGRPAWVIERHAGSPAGRGPDSPVLWRTGLGNLLGDPVPVGDRVLVGTNDFSHDKLLSEGDAGVMACLDAGTGELLWRHAHPRLDDRQNDAPLRPIHCRPAAAGERVVYLSNRGVLTCVDLRGFRDGENDGPRTDETDTRPTDADLLWEVDFPGDHGVFKRDEPSIGGLLSGPLILGDLVYCGTGQGVDRRTNRVPDPAAPSLAAVRLADGEVVWTSAAPGEHVVLGQWSSPVALPRKAGDGTAAVLFGGGDSLLYAFEPRTGQRLWALDLGGGTTPADAGWRGRGRRNLFFAPPVVADGVIYIGLNQSLDERRLRTRRPIYAIETDADGLNPRIAWTFDPPAFLGTHAAVAVAGDRLFVLGRDESLWCVDRASGKELWHVGFDHWPHAPFSPPVVRDGRLYVSLDADLYVFDATSPGPAGAACVGRYRFGPGVGSFRTGPAPAADGVLLGASDAIWKLRPPRDLPAPR